MFIGNLNSIGNLPIGGAGSSYLLDTYSAESAYSLRQLKTGVTNVVRVRRSSDSAESDFTATEITDGTLTTWTGANDGFVVTLYDQQNANDATQATAADQGKLVSAGVVITENGKPCITFDGSSDHLDLTVTLGLTGGLTEFAYFMVSTIPSNANSYMLGGSLSGSGPAIIANFTGSSVEYFIGGGDRQNFQASSTPGDQRLLATIMSKPSNYLKTYSNGTLGVSGTPSSSYTNFQVKKIAMSNTVNYSDTNFQELVLYKSDEDSNRTSIESDINTYYSIY